jgi:hypothetical protein
MRIDILPLCDQHYRTMEFSIAPHNSNYSIEYFRCTDKFCHRCFSESLGYVTPVKDAPPLISANQRRCEKHGRPMFISSVDRQRNLVRYVCPEEGCREHS